MRTLVKICCVLLLLPSVALAAKEKFSAVPGGVAIVDLKNFNTKPKVKFLGKPVLVRALEGVAGGWQAIVGLPVETRYGQQQIEVFSGSSSAFKKNFSVSEKNYPTEYINVKNKQMVNPNESNLARIQKESVKIKQALASWSDKAPDDLQFKQPVEGRFSSPFGLRRFFNGHPRKPHQGLDIAAPEGTPVLAPKVGKVVDTGSYYFNGNMIVLDHGAGLLSLYCHLSEIKVKVGDAVKIGDEIGLVGKTGRVTGAHLHWALLLNQAKVDPQMFLVSEKEG